MDNDAHLSWLTETADETLFEGDVVRKGPPRSGPVGELSFGVEFDVTRGGWDKDPGPDIWLTEHLLTRFEGHRVRLTIEDLGPTPSDS